MNNQQLLERAAKSLNLEGTYVPEDEFSPEAICWTDENDCNHYWNPLFDDGEALRLAAYHYMHILYTEVHDVWCCCVTSDYLEGDWIEEPVRTFKDKGSCVATRLAITKTAALMSERRYG